MEDPPLATDDKAQPRSAEGAGAAKRIREVDKRSFSFCLELERQSRLAFMGGLFQDVPPALLAQDQSQDGRKQRKAQASSSGEDKSSSGAVLGDGPGKQSAQIANEGPSAAEASTAVQEASACEQGEDFSAQAPASAPSKSSPAPRQTLPRPETIEPCPRCSSEDTKFCYYNNYNIKQPRYYCKVRDGEWAHIPCAFRSSARDPRSGTLSKRRSSPPPPASTTCFAWCSLSELPALLDGWRRAQERPARLWQAQEQAPRGAAGRGRRRRQGS